MRKGDGTRRCVLELFDPIDSTNTVVANRLVPLESDISTALGYKLEKGRENNESLIATIGLLDPAKARRSSRDSTWSNHTIPTRYPC